MTHAATELQKAVIAHLSAAAGLAEISGVHDGPPPRAAFPYVSVGDSPSLDWSTKTETGREIRLALTLWDDGDTPSRLHRLTGALEVAMAGLPRLLTGWRIVSLVFHRSIIARDPAGPWAGLVEHRIRLLQTEEI